MSRWFGSVVTAGVLCVSHARAQELVYFFVGENPDDKFGTNLASGGDADGDGVWDLWVRAPDNDEAASLAGKAYLFSGATGLKIAEFLGHNPSERYGFASFIGDVNQDGQDDFVLSSRDANGPTGLQQGMLEFHLDFTTDSPEFVLYGEHREDKFGGALSFLGDVDGDSVNDILVGADNYTWFTPFHAGRAYVFSGATQEAIYTLTGEADTDGFGSELVGGLKLDDGPKPDFLVSADSAGPVNNGKVYAYSGDTGELLYDIVGVDGGGLEDVDIVGDIDGDGYDDFVAGSPTANEAAASPTFIRGMMAL